MKPALNLTLAACLALGGLTGCASSKPSFGDQVAEVSKDWRKGEAMVREGEKKIKSGKSDIRAGEKLLEKGRDAEAKWVKRRAADQSTYDKAVQLSGGAESATEVASEAKVLRNLQRSILEAEDEIKDARQLQSKGKELIREGKDRLRQGEDRVDEGEKRMKRARRDYKSVID